MTTTIDTDADLVLDDPARERAIEELGAYLPAQARSGTAIEAVGIDVRFGGVHALRSASMTVEAGSFTGLIGPNGAGKSTLFDVINGFTKPGEGTVTLFDRDVTSAGAADRARLGMSRTFQANHIDPLISVRDNLIAGGYLSIRGGVIASTLRLRTSWADEQRVARVADAVAQALHLDGVLHEAAGNLNFGAQRRVEIGRSLMSGPRVLLLDEPAAGVDATEALSLMALIKDLQTRLGLTVVLIEHHVQSVLENCDAIYALDQGSIIASGTPDHIATNDAVKSAYLGGA